MQTTLEEEQTSQPAVHRSVLYRFLSLAFRPPDEGFAGVAANGELRTALEVGVQAAGEPAVNAMMAALAACTGLDPALLADDYDRIFSHQVGVDCPLYEAQYVSGGVFAEAQCIADVAGFYRAFGLEAGDLIRERPDHLSLELEFMHALAYREAYARAFQTPTQVEVLVDTQRAFLRDHLARWAPTLSRLVARRTKGPYRALAVLLSIWIDVEAHALGIGSVEEAGVALSPNPLDLEGGDPSCASFCPVEVSE